MCTRSPASVTGCAGGNGHRACVLGRRAVWNDRWEMTYVGPSQVLIKPLKGGGRGVILKSQYGYEIEDVKFMGTVLH